MLSVALYPEQTAARACACGYYESSSSDLVAFARPYHRRMVAPSQMFTIKLMLAQFQQENPGQEVYDASQGDGGASLGGIPKSEIVAALNAFLPETATTSYGLAGGRESVRRDALEHWWGFGEGTGLDPSRIVFTNGGRGALLTWYTIVRHLEGAGGDVIVSAAPWGSYPQGLFLNHLNMLCAPGHAANAFRLTPDALREACAYSRHHQRYPAGLIVTSPDNPTGNALALGDLAELIETGAELDIPHLFIDLMYQAVTTTGRYDIPQLRELVSPEAWARVTFMDGLTKCAGASNARNAHLLLGSEPTAKLALAISTHVDFVNDLGMALAASVYALPDPCDHAWIRRVVGPTNQSRAVAVAGLARHRIRCIADQGYYAFVNVWPWLDKTIPADLRWADGPERVTDVNVLVAYLAKKHGIAVIPGSAFRQNGFVRFSVANAPAYTERAIERFAAGLASLT